jgi:hypothetical protein
MKSILANVKLLITIFSSYISSLTTIMASIFKAEKFPYLLAALFAILAWATTHIADRYTNSPIVKYSIELIPLNQKYKATYHVKNISADKAFENIDFFLIADKPDSIFCVKRSLFPPIKVNSDVDFYAVQDNSATVHIDRLQPNEHFDIIVEKKLDNTIALRISSKSTVILETWSTETFILEHEITILGIIVSICVLLIIIYVSYYGRAVP